MTSANVQIKGRFIDGNLAYFEGQDMDETPLTPAALTDRTEVPVEAFGDSRQGGSLTQDATEVTAAQTTVLTVTNGDTYQTNGGPDTMFEYLACGAVKLQRRAISGSQSGGANGLAAQLAASKAAGSLAGKIVIPWTSANDRNAGVPVETSLQNLATFVADAVAAGARVLMPLEPPQRGGFWSGDKPTAWAAYVAGQRALAATYGPRFVRLADTMSPMSAAYGTAIAAGNLRDPYYDDVHTNHYGGFGGGHALLVGAGDWLPSNPLRAGLMMAETGNVLPNGAMLGSKLNGESGAIAISTGDTADGWESRRHLGNSWDLSLTRSQDVLTRINGQTYERGQRLYVPGYEGWEFVCATAGAVNGSPPATFNTGLFATTTDGAVTLYAMPAFRGFDGRRAQMIFGTGTADNTRGTIHRDITLAAAGLQVGQRVRASAMHWVVGHYRAFQWEMQFMAAGAKMYSVWGMLGNYTNPAGVGAGMVGRLVTPDVPQAVIPTGCDSIKVRFMGLSGNGRVCGHAITDVRLRPA